MSRLRMVGLELRDRDVTAVDVDDEGRILVRADAEVTTDPAAAAFAALGATTNFGDATLAHRLPKATMDALRIVPALLGVDGPAIGAARLTAVALP